MQYIGLIILGLIAGFLAKLLMPGKDPGGWIVTILIGIAGAFLGSFIAQYLPFLPDASVHKLLPSLGAIITATIGAFILLLLYRLIFGRK